CAESLCDVDGPDPKGRHRNASAHTPAHCWRSRGYGRHPPCSETRHDGLSSVPSGGSDGGGRLFVHVRSNPYALVTPITRIMHNLSAEQPVERAATLEDIRAEV